MDFGPEPKCKKCSCCGETKPVDVFYTQFDRNKGYRYPRGDCKECVKIERKNFAKRKPEHQRTLWRTYYQKHRLKRVARKKIYYRENKAKCFESNRRWSKTAKGRLSSRIQVERRRARIQEVSTAESALITSKWFVDLMIRQGHKCFYCGGELLNAEMDHKQPISCGGKHVPENIVASCRRCNRRKGTRSVEEFLESMKPNENHQEKAA